jgi:glycosyltransferase involved in cell wall biosynthesis
MPREKNLRLLMILDLAAKKWGGTESALLHMTRKVCAEGGSIGLVLQNAANHVAADLEAAGATLFPLDTAEKRRSQNLLAAVRAFRPTVITVQFFPIFHWIAPFLWLWSGARIIVVDDHSGAGKERTGLARRLFQVAHRVRALFVYRHVAVSDFVRNRLLQKAGLRPSEVARVFNGVKAVDTQAIHTGAHAAPSPDVFCAAHLIPEKGIHTLLQACALLREKGYNARVQIAGEGPQRNELESFAAKEGLSVSFLGLRDDVAARMARANITVVPSQWQEAFGFTVAEAMMAGSCVVASRVGGIPEIVDHGRTGFLVEPADAQALADALFELLMDPLARFSMARRGQQRANRLFSVDSMIDGLKSQIEEAHHEALRRPAIPFKRLRPGWSPS